MLKIFYKIIFCYVLFFFPIKIFASNNFKYNSLSESKINLRTNKTSQNINEINLEKNQNLTENTDINENDFKDDASIFGVIKKVVDDKKVVKKFETDEDKIFLNKDIFDQNQKESLRKSLIPAVNDVIPDYRFSQRIISDLSITKNYGNLRHDFYDSNAIVRYYPSLNFKNNIELNGIFRFARFDNELDILKRESNMGKSGSRAFENMGINISELNFKYTKNNSSIIIGKFTANFGLAWRWNKGIFIHTLASQYNLNEKLGVALITKYGNSKKTGIYNLSFATFTNDRKNLDNTLFHRRQSEKKNQALPGDTRSLSSYSLALDINFDFGKKEKLLYHMARSYLVVNKRASLTPQSQIRNQLGYVYGMNYLFPIYNIFETETIVEYATIKNVNGIRGISSNYLTTNLTLKYLNYSFMIGNSTNDLSNVNDQSKKNKLTEFNIGYQFDKNKYYDKISTIIGYYQSKNYDFNSKRIDKSFAILLRYFKNF